MNIYFKIVFLFLAGLHLLTLNGGFDGKELEKNVKKFRNHGVVIRKIPQVKQRRNYCVPATIEMVMRYYGVKVYQRRLASLFKTSHNKGTRMDFVMAVFESGNSHVKDLTMENIYSLTEQELDMMENAILVYTDKKRKKSNEKLTADERLARIKGRDARKVFPGLRQETARKLQAAMTDYVAKGIPVLWGVEMCFDPKYKSKGGHIRLIVGFSKNKKTDEIDEVVFRDAWFTSSENKTMSFDDALTMTTGLWVIIPRGMTGFSQ